MIEFWYDTITISACPRNFKCYNRSIMYPLSFRSCVVSAFIHPQVLHRSKDYDFYYRYMESYNKTCWDSTSTRKGKLCEVGLHLEANTELTMKGRYGYLHWDSTPRGSGPSSSPCTPCKSSFAQIGPRISWSPHAEQMREATMPYPPSMLHASWRRGKGIGKRAITVTSTYPPPFPIWRHHWLHPCDWLGLIITSQWSNSNRQSRPISDIEQYWIYNCHFKG